MLYSLPANWSKLTLPTLAYALPVPQRYYVPRRMRSMYLPRLEAAGLWKPEPIESKGLQFSKSSADDKEQIAQTFQRDKVGSSTCSLST
jgi:sorting and assembly machinery component 37